MKNIYLLLITIFIAVECYPQTTVITDQYGKGEAKPLSLKNGDTLVVKNTMVVVIDTARYSFYKQLHKNIINDKIPDFNSMISSFGKSLAELKDGNDSLDKNHRETFRLLYNTVQSNQNTLLEIDKKINSVQNQIKSSYKNIDDAETYIKKEKWSLLGKKIIIAFGGAAVGLLTGILIAQ